MKASGKALKIVRSPSTELAGLVSDYLDEQRSHNLSPRSVDMSRVTLEKIFLPWASDRGVGTSAQVNQTTLEAWSRYLLEERRTPKGELLKPESVRSYVRTARGFIKWAQERGEVDGKVKLVMPKSAKRTPDILTRREMRSIEDAATSERDKLIIALLSTTGIRLGELVSLRHDDLSKAKGERYIRLHGKGSKDRVVPLEPEMYDRLTRYAKRAQAREATSFIFTTDRKPIRRMSTRSVQQAVHYAAEKAGIEKRVHVHMFRHSAATWMVNRKMPVDHIRRVLGHADLDLIVNVYSHVQPSDLYKSMMEAIRDDEDERER